jgi:uncharacterized protein
MRIAITGSRGLIGSALVVHLRSQGHTVVPLVRTNPQPGEITWDPRTGELSIELLKGTDAVVHLAGAGVGDHRWSKSYKDEIVRSRLDGTSTLANALAEMIDPPSVLLSASAVGYYGSRGDEALTESSTSGEGFLAELCAKWEAATSPASEQGVRVAHLRTGIVLSASGGALRKQLPMFRAGLGARLGSGDHYLSWITRRDAVAAMAFVLNHPEIAGALNVTSPEPVTNHEFTKVLAKAIRRPAMFAVPRFLLEVVMGREMTSEFLLGSQRAFPKRLLDAGFSFADPSLSEGLAAALGDRSLATLP